MQTKKIVYVAAVVESVLFGLTFLGSKIALTQLDAIQVLACRWTIAMILFLVLALFKVIRVNYRGKQVWLVALAAFIQPCINTICETYGVDLTTASESAIIYAMIPIAVVLISAVVLKHKIRPIVAGGILLSFLGVILSIVFSDGFSMGGKIGGYLFLIGMVITGAVFTILSGHISDRFSAMERTFTMALMGGIWFNLLNVIRGNGFTCYTICFQYPKVGLAVLFLGAVGSFACYILFNYVVSKMPAPQASMLQVNLIALTGVVTGILFQGDDFGWYTAAGLILVVAGVIAANWTSK
ncbi:DMT family transporter [Anaerovorax odorimutans]|uniref:DMT family transporter n=1 Tax=Anaerovorax odorimutans TaxID=109327 RepID=A0ABT1RTJ7_9FIRM|nr:DMT family transporter [Anaerovorax odorimutans]MCQ4638502.1 DMT family transporter [Anaerovorax odorimutans]